MNPVRVPSRIR